MYLLQLYDVILIAGNNLPDYRKRAETLVIRTLDATFDNRSLVSA